jgi:hypothetical protein
MPKETVIRKKAIQILEGAGWITWYPSKVKYKQNDIFGIIDLLAIKGGKQKNIQLTTLPNISTKRKKITNFLKKFKVELPVEIWAWSKKQKWFRIEKINLKTKKDQKFEES